MKEYKTGLKASAAICFIGFSANLLLSNYVESRFALGCLLAAFCTLAIIDAIEKRR